MNETPRLPRWRRALGAVAACSAVVMAVVGCQDRPICPVSPSSVAVVYERLAVGTIDKIDILLDVDNSASMRDKQALLSLAVPDLVEGLVNPPCLDDKGSPVSPQPAGPLEACPQGAHRLFDPILDIHVGMITTSLGGHGATQCEINHPSQASNNDKGHLVFRADPVGPNNLPTYQGKGFLAWDPSQQLAPPGEADLQADSAADPDTTALVPVLRDMIAGAGEDGCGYESQLESWYRFLVDPAPSAEIVVGDDGVAVHKGTDEALLAQRKAFLRPDSLLAIVLLTDEDDCSVREDGTSYRVLQMYDKNGNYMPIHRGRAVCQTNPGDACCYPCTETTPQLDENGEPCPEDPTCLEYDGVALDDALSLRCWDQKRRFGKDFLYPIERYTRALTRETVTDRDGKEVPNPLFSDLDPDDGLGVIRRPEMVILTGIAGVPWQDIARDPNDLKKGFQTPAELDAKGPSGKTAWEIVLGDPEKNIPPADPLMIPSNVERSGVHPITGEPVAHAWDNPLGNSINGHDYRPGGWLEYACVFPLTEPMICGQTSGCNDPVTSPVYDPAPVGPEGPDKQVRAGALPGRRILSLLRSLGDQAVVASTCPAQTSDPGALDFGYRPAVTAARRRLEAEISGGCFARELDVEPDGQVACVLVEARRSGPEGVCCDPAEARLDLTGPRAAALEALKQDGAVAAQGYDCFCEIPQLDGAEPGEPLYTCQNDVAETPLDAAGEPLHGYCYIDTTATPPTGNPDLVKSCRATEKRRLRLLGKGKPAEGSTLFITCAATADEGVDQCSPAP